MLALPSVINLSCSTVSLADVASASANVLCICIRRLLSLGGRWVVGHGARGYP